MAMRAATLFLILMAPVAALAAEPVFTEDFPLKSCQFTSQEGNKYFPLVPGRQLYYNNSRCVSEGDCDELEELWITTEFQTRRITLGSGAHRRQVVTRVVEERETEDGELKEISRNFFALCAPARDLYYFGEEVDIYEDGEIVSHDGAWIAGRHGALPGIIMPDSAFLLGTRYFQEQARPALRWIGPNTSAQASRSTFLRAPSKDASKPARPHRSSQVRNRPRSIVPA